MVGGTGASDATSAEGLVGWIFAHGRGAVELADGAVRIVDDPGAGNRAIGSDAMRFARCGSDSPYGAKPSACFECVLR